MSDHLNLIYASLGALAALIFIVEKLRSLWRR
ncbi:hypothetical protein SAMN05519103_04001 [Rhizobiales bacterium GAS113]|nr:hypothetical protein SAMN05519103_04001 [Rhizobiales bacterium GAS113]